jgi:hypothetical protein
MKIIGLRTSVLLSGVMLLQACVAYPVSGGPYYGNRNWDGPTYRLQPAPIYEIHDRGPPPRSFYEHREPQRDHDRDHEREHGDRGRSRR